MKNQNAKAQSTTNTATPMPTPTATPILLDGGLLLEEIEGVLVEVAIVLVDGVCEVIGAGVVVVGVNSTRNNMATTP